MAIYDMSVCMDVTLLKFSNHHPNSDSVADATKFFMILHFTCTGTFDGGIACSAVLGFGPKRKYPSALLCASGYEMWDASEYI